MAANTGLSLEEAYRLWNRLMQTPGVQNPSIHRDLEPQTQRYYSEIGPWPHHFMMEDVNSGGIQ